MKKAFSLVELIVVIAIIAILAGVLMASFGGGTASARAAACISNMRNLAAAAQTYGMASGYYPCAGNVAYINMSESRSGGTLKVTKTVKDTPGWISAMTQNLYPSHSDYSKPETVGMYCADREDADYALTNGVLWKYVSGSRKTYVCPEHAIAGKNKSTAAGGKGASVSESSAGPHWSYLLNARFGWDKTGRACADSDAKRVDYGDLARADKILLFAEVPFKGFNTWQPGGSGAGTDTDAILQYSESYLDSDDKGSLSGGGDNAEEIGVNHKSGRGYAAHVAFADGHVEKLRIPMNGKKPDTSQMAQLASWLCVGYDVSYDPKTGKYVRTAQ